MSAQVEPNRATNWSVSATSTWAMSAISRGITGITTPRARASSTMVTKMNSVAARLGWGWFGLDWLNRAPPEDERDRQPYL